MFKNNINVLFFGWIDFVKVNFVVLICVVSVIFRVRVDKLCVIFIFNILMLKSCVLL